MPTQPWKGGVSFAAASSCYKEGIDFETSVRVWVGRSCSMS